MLKSPGSMGAKAENEELLHKPYAHYRETNRDLWNGWTSINKHTSFYALDEFKSGATSLKPVELEALGDVSGKSMLHLQCHFGLDSLSWARLGAHVTAVDLSDEAIATASALSTELDIPARFICSDVYDLPKYLDEKFDIVFTSYGVLNWLKDIDRWAEIVAHYLKPGGIFYIVEFHPLINMLEDDFRTIRSDAYFSKTEPRCTLEKGSYADLDAEFEHESYEWHHSLGSISNALRRAGIIYESLEELPYSSHHCFPNLVEREGRFFSAEGIPLMFSIKGVFHPELKMTPFVSVR